MPGNDDRFTGADGLTPGTMQHTVHLAMMTNELHGVEARTGSATPCSPPAARPTARSSTT